MDICLISSLYLIRDQLIGKHQYRTKNIERKVNLPSRHNELGQPVGPSDRSYSASFSQTYFGVEVLVLLFSTCVSLVREEYKTYIEYTLLLCAARKTFQYRELILRADVKPVFNKQWTHQIGVLPWD